MHDVVALLQNVGTKHFESGHAVLLHRGQIGTVVMKYDDGACEVEFSDRDGRAFAILSLSPDQLMVLRDTPEDGPQLSPPPPDRPRNGRARPRPR